jgi:peptidoglycan/xylan/chitin deacetylase (PgdA/CDA1 family)
MSARVPGSPGEDERYYLHERYRGERRRMAPSLRAFYAVKPAIPRPVQLALRRAYAHHQARRRFPAWPVEPVLVERRSAALLAQIRAQGGRATVLGLWPEGRRFAAVLTHDVEGERGVQTIRAVREVERRHGFVSSWNFVARWYPIPDGLFSELRADGCEIGLHGIHHDGRLFRDRASFEAELSQIHHYLDAWQAVGFRSPATHRNPDWISELGCLYDSSFPDTDPFEPQPGGCCSILPFLLGPVVELPITLPQDHTVLEVLRQPSTALWREKADWIVRHHGLVNLIVHPDYVGSPQRLALYDEFLAHLRERVDREEGWAALPREVAAWWRDRAAHLEAGGPLPDGGTLLEATEASGEVVLRPLRSPVPSTPAPPEPA